MSTVKITDNVFILTGGRRITIRQNPAICEIHIWCWIQVDYWQVAFDEDILLVFQLAELFLYDSVGLILLVFLLFE